MFDINTTDTSPIWQQIEEGMRRMIALGSLKPGDAVPSVRDLARTLRVNPNTVARAYQRLTDHGVFSVRRGDVGAVAASDREDTVIGQPLVCTRDRIGVHAKGAGQITDGGDRVSRLQRAERDHPPHAFLDLLPDGRGVCCVDIEHERLVY